MPQQDRHKERIIPIEFNFYDILDKLPIQERCSIILITCGSVTAKINSHIRRINSPCAICLSQYDSWELIHSENLSAKSFHFDPWYIKANLCFDNLDDAVEIDPQYIYDRIKLYMFTKHTNLFQGIITLTPQNYIHINELMLMIGAETYSQSDDFWTCRIRRMLLQLLNCLYDIFVDQRKLKFFETPESYNPATICAEYIHKHYAENITLSTLCELVNINRTTLNQKFKTQFSYTCMDYLLNYRLKISQELLSNSNMKIHEIAESCGFKYDSYFIKQFTAKLGISPAMYRKNPLKYSSFDGKKIKEGAVAK